MGAASDDSGAGAAMRWSFDEQFRSLSSASKGGVRDPVGMVSVKEDTESGSTVQRRSSKDLLLKASPRGITAAQRCVRCARCSTFVGVQKATELSYSPAKNFMMTGAAMNHLIVECSTSAVTLTMAYRQGLCYG